MAALVVATILSKLAGAGLGGVRLSLRDRLVVGAGMIPRGEVALAVATAGLAAGRLPAQVFAALVAAVLFSSLAGPAALQMALPDRRPLRRPSRDSPPEGSGAGLDEDV